TSAVAALSLDLTHAPQANNYTGWLDMTSAAANTVTVPANASVAFPVGTAITIMQAGDGQTTIAAEAGVTVVNASSAKTRAKFSVLTLVKRAANTWT
ncbi:hypothetical protein, partial [Klebsiella pneumoniae]|uniref:hypothetical protein n=1 Tax=Klebsiella pneumoniae TaxID=573 RepID=UPI0021581CD0